MCAVSSYSGLPPIRFRRYGAQEARASRTSRCTPEQLLKVVAAWYVSSTGGGEK
jgi:hypothetical protein